MYVGVNLNFKYPFLYLFIALTGGIISSEYLHFPAWIFCIPLFLAFFTINKFRLLTDLLLISCIFFIGIEISFHSVSTYSPNNTYLIRSRCQEILTNHHYILSIGEQLFYLNNHYTDTLYSPGDSLAFYANIFPFKHQSNPGEFSYAHYLKQKQIFHQLIPISSIQKIGFSHDIPSFFYQLREKIIKKTARLTQDSTCQQLINALCLGSKLELNNEFRKLFSITGTIHLLSVSGLHTGALYLFFLFVLQHLGLKKRKSELYLLPFLWSYACLTGLSPSVVRASTILSFIAFGKAFHRTYIPLNALCASAFLTLIVNPSTLYSISFLLSYSAYSGILIFYPLLLKLPRALSPIPSKIYACCCITIAAQLPTLPLSAYYFHSINLNGFLANLIAIPIATLFLYCAAGCLLLPLWISKQLSFFCELLSRLLIQFLHFFAPYSINLEHLYPSPLTIFLIYSCMIFTGYYFFHPQRKWLYFTIISYCNLLLLLIGQQLYFNSIQEIVVLHYPKQSVILLQYHGFCIPLKNTQDSSIIHHPYVQIHHSTLLPQHSAFLDKTLFYFENQLIYSNDTLLILSNSSSKYTPCTILIINNNLSPKQIFLHPEPIFPKQIILDGSNHKYTIAEWQTFCKVHQIPFQATSKNGFIQFELK